MDHIYLKIFVLGLNTTVICMHRQIKSLIKTSPVIIRHDIKQCKANYTPLKNFFVNILQKTVEKSCPKYKTFKPILSTS